MSRPPARSRAAFLMLADGRIPAGGYAHSGSLEPAIASGDVASVGDLHGFLAGRLRTNGLVAATFAAAACRLTRSGTEQSRDTLAGLDAELDARTPSPAQRQTSRQLGRQLARAVASIAPQVDLGHLGTRPHQPVVLGSACAQLDLAVEDAALACLHESAAGPVAAAVRLLRTDPFATHRVLADLGGLIDDLVAEAVTASLRPEDLPAPAAPMLDTHAERHLTRTTRLFAS